ncbi:hypothetical protein [Lactonifactor longoviformis]|uniref:Uncharacterized protein n=1 Tax=Lactonifactor longoviformis DSM 17459 TaxID=1122155 RepID=A0A1M5CY54_9CLOT|nr:hypothetical protein [Lactonifactor longoviformis]SHF59640.1 hypothetical protein SAMN02745158_04342 [Lactonifactor longoviformis DSM 17459]
MNFFKKLIILIEGKKIERNLKHSDLDRMEPPKELYNRIVQQLKDMGIYHNTPDE